MEKSLKMGQVFSNRALEASGSWDMTISRLERKSGQKIYFQPKTGLDKNICSAGTMIEPCNTAVFLTDPAL